MLAAGYVWESAVFDEWGPTTSHEIVSTGRRPVTSPLNGFKGDDSAVRMSCGGFWRRTKMCMTLGAGSARPCSAADMLPPLPCRRRCYAAAAATSPLPNRCSGAARIDAAFGKVIWNSPHRRPSKEQRARGVVLAAPCHRLRAESESWPKERGKPEAASRCRKGAGRKRTHRRTCAPRRRLEMAKAQREGGLYVRAPVPITLAAQVVPPGLHLEDIDAYTP